MGFITNNIQNIQFFSARALINDTQRNYLCQKHLQMWGNLKAFYYRVDPGGSKGSWNSF